MSEYDEVAVSWEAEAREKKLPEEFIERLAGSDAVTEKEKARIVASVSTAAELLAKRRKAIAYGKLLGEDEARSRRETEHNADQRIKRAMAYAAWEFDGKPLSSKPQREEMGVIAPDIPGYEDQAAMWAKRGEQDA